MTTVGPLFHSPKLGWKIYLRFASFSKTKKKGEVGPIVWFHSIIFNEGMQDRWMRCFPTFQRLRSRDCRHFYMCISMRRCTVELCSELLKILKHWAISIIFSPSGKKQKKEITRRTSRVTRRNFSTCNTKFKKFRKRNLSQCFEFEIRTRGILLSKVQTWKNPKK